MKTLREVGYSILNPINGFITNDDQRIDIEWVYDKIWDVYSRLKQKYYDKYGYLAPADYSQTCCLDVQCREVKCDDEGTGEKQFFIELPDIDWMAAPDPIVYLGSDNLKNRFSYKSINGYENSDEETYISGKPIYTIVGSEAWLKNLPTSSMTKACIIAVLENPGDKCFPDDKFPAPRAFLYELELLVKKDALSTLGINPDLLNNANNQFNQPAQPQRQPQAEQENEQ